MKKKTSRKSPGVKPYTVGMGFTEKRKYRIDLTGSLSPEGRALLEKGQKGLNPFDAKTPLAEASARRILERAGLPTDPAGFSSSRLSSRRGRAHGADHSGAAQVANERAVRDIRRLRLRKADFKQQQVLQYVPHVVSCF